MFSSKKEISSLPTETVLLPPFFTQPSKDLDGDGWDTTRRQVISIFDTVLSFRKFQMNRNPHFASNVPGF
jgi:hypothetical protein